MTTTALFPYLLHLGDNALILAQRNAEWTGHGPVLEQDIAITNISLDLLGQARNFYQYAAELHEGMSSAEKKEVDQWLPRPWKTFNRELNEDDLAFLREERQFLNVLISELPRGDWAQSVLRQFFFSAWQYFQYEALAQCSDERIAGIAEKSIKEVAYHLRWSGEWVIRLGDSTEESRRRIEAALELLWSYTGELFLQEAFEKTGVAETWAADAVVLKEKWNQKLSAVFEEATLTLPKDSWSQSGGKDGRHTEHLGYLLAEMQYLQRTYPNLTW